MAIRIGLSAVPRVSLPKLTIPAGSRPMITDPTAASGEPAGFTNQAARSEIPMPAAPATTPARAAHVVWVRVGRGRSTGPWSVAHDPFTTGVRDRSVTGPSAPP
jgi:hypothetical protein